MVSFIGIAINIDYWLWYWNQPYQIYNVGNDIVGPIIYRMPQNSI